MTLPLKVGLHGDVLDDRIQEIVRLVSRAHEIVSRPDEEAFGDGLVSCFIETSMGATDPRVKSVFVMDECRRLTISRPVGPLMPSNSGDKPSAVRSSVEMVLHALSVIERGRDLHDMERMERIAQLVRSTTGNADIDFVATRSPWSPAELQSTDGDVLSSEAFDAFVSSRIHPFAWLSIGSSPEGMTIRMSREESFVGMGEVDPVELMRITVSEDVGREEILAMLNDDSR